MALYQHLPIFKTSYDLLLLLFQLTKKFPREFKYTIGEELKKLCLSLVVGIYDANSSTDKLLVIKDLRRKLEMIKILMRIVKDLHIISLPQSAQSMLFIDSLSKQLVWWERSMK